MKRVFIILLAFIFTFISCTALNFIADKTISVSNLTDSRVPSLVIDAGHGGIDSGTIGVDSAKEKNINLAIALKLYDFAMVSGVTAYMTRDSDCLVYSVGDDTSRSDLYNRMDFINSIDNCVLISIHQNHYDDESEKGMQVWYSPNDSESRILADDILNVTKLNLQSDNERLNKPSDDSYYLLYKAQVPSVMVECGFMSNAGENKKLQDDEYQRALAYSIMLGLDEYITEV